MSIPFAMIENQQNSKDYSEIILILFGWLLGIISSMLIEMYKNFLTKKETKKGIKSELNELKLRLAAINLELTFRSGVINLEYAKWIKPYYRLLFEDDTYFYLRTVPRIENLISDLSDEEFENCLNVIKNRRALIDQLTTPSISKIVLPYLDSKYSSISLFKEKSLLQFAQLRKEVTHFNDCVDDIKYYYNKSFEILTDPNRQIIENNLNNNVAEARDKTKHIIRLIEEISK